MPHAPGAPDEVGTNLRHLCGMHDLRQRDLAGQIGISAQGLWNILNGTSEPRLGTARRLAVTFGITLDQLFGDTGTCLRAAANVFERAPARDLRLAGDRPIDPTDDDFAPPIPHPARPNQPPVPPESTASTS